MDETNLSIELYNYVCLLRWCLHSRVYWLRVLTYTLKSSKVVFPSESW